MDLPELTPHAVEWANLPSHQELLTLAEALSLYANGDKYQRAVELAEAVIRAFAAIRARSEQGKDSS